MDKFGNKLFLVLSIFLSCFPMTISWLKSCMLVFGKLHYCTQPGTDADMTVAVMGCHQGVNPNAHHQKAVLKQSVSEDTEKTRHQWKTYVLFFYVDTCTPECATESFYCK